MVINIDDLKKRILYRATYRGTKEMDKILISFTKKYINIFNLDELNELDELINIDDENLYKSNKDENLTIKIKKNMVTDLFKKFIYKN